MFGKILSACVVGVDGRIVETEVDISRGLPAFHIVGLPDSSIRESMERVRAAIRHCGYEFPLQRITVNLAPADLKKEGSAFDLAIAAGILTASGQLPAVDVAETLVIGELSLDGRLRPVPGVLAMVIHAVQQGIRTVILPAANAAEASLAGELRIVPIEHLSQLKEAMTGKTQWRHVVHRESQNPTSPANTEDYADVRGQEQAKRALTIAAAGMHNIVLIGPPGTGKTMLMRRLPTILSDLDDDEALEVTKIYSIASLLPDRSGLIRKRPFRSPHHSISLNGLIGGGPIPRPGEISLSHRGVLYLDELPEFPRHVLESLRQPLEDRRGTISRAKASYTFPCDFLLAASMNPCPCGLGYGGADPQRRACTCSPAQIQKYRAKISGPLLDRIDMQVEVPPPGFQAMSSDAPAWSSERMKRQVEIALRVQAERYRHNPGIRFNSELTGSRLHEVCRLTDAAQKLLQESFEALGLSARAYGRILRLARTIADLEGGGPIDAAHVAEAVQYRRLDRAAPPA